MTSQKLTEGRRKASRLSGPLYVCVSVLSMVAQGTPDPNVNRAHSKLSHGVAIGCTVEGLSLTSVWSTNIFLLALMSSEVQQW
ncbi:hypothetical protein DL89DRAFT_143333 [Linderina pennispora]|uniref:Uncharacterized protein n=1 Tax=Linderina pennispora TaxID=61395 RepID=A0A1Y1WC29_9FUNG|nr:uncharacterized protein DL89DRAFT_143333 [Linderina pennispora]ORX70925.1 hypothetical protein DL89DRAFT_143333 [Linderina pennispora]